MSKSITFDKTIDFPEWFREIVSKGKLIEYYDVKGCYVLLPNSLIIWNNIKNYLDTELKKRDVENYYFPLFVTKKNLEKEQSHLEGFKAEVAWIKDNEEIAIRPTSECIICPVIAKQIRSHQDLPKKVNQYVNVFRDEIKETVPFIRSREFLWQEGHSYYSNEDDAKNEVTDIINLYRHIYEDLLAVPVILGTKTKMETFSGAKYTYTLEGFIPEAGKGIQCATSHYLEHNFSKMFDIKFLNKKMKHEYCYYNSWGITTRCIGVMIQTHSDNKGLVFPPRIAPIHVVIIPICGKSKEDHIINYINKLKEKLSEKFSVKIDSSKETPGFKFNKWEQEGVPLRVEIGEKELMNKRYTAVRRDSGEKISLSESDDLDVWQSLLDQMQNDMYERAKDKLLNSVNYVNIDTINQENISGKINISKFCGSNKCEIEMKEKYGMKSLCLPEDNKIKYPLDDECGCIICGSSCEKICLFGKTY